MKSVKSHQVGQAQGEFRKMDGNDGIVTVTEWWNGEGYDIIVDGDNKFNISVTHEEYDVISLLIKYLQIVEPNNEQ
jgi:hypothetical protein